MSTNNYKEKTEFSVSMCIIIVVLIAISSTATTMVYASYHSSSKSPSSDSGSRSSMSQSDTNSESSGSRLSGSSNGTGNSAGDSSGNIREESRLSQDSITSGSGNSLGQSSNLGSTPHCDRLAYQSCFTNNSNQRSGSTYNNNTSSSLEQSETAHCIGNHCSSTTSTKVTGLGTIREIAPGAPAGSHTLEYTQAFNTASANPYKPGSKQYQDYQAGLDAAKKAGRDCDKMDTCGGPDLLGNTVNGVLHLNDEQYCGNGFGVHSSKLCKFPKGCTENRLGTISCPPPQPPSPRNCYHILGKFICHTSIHSPICYHESSYVRCIPHIVGSPTL